MGNSRAPEATRDQYIRDMGPELGPVYNALHHDLLMLHAAWNQFRLLFDKSEQRFEMLDEVAGHFFQVIRVVIVEYVVLGIVRLTDPDRTGRTRENLTLCCLPDLVTDSQLKTELESLVEDAVRACEVPRLWRNKLLAHRDRAVALASARAPLPEISWDGIEGALERFRHILNRLERHYCNFTYCYPLFAPIGNADDLVYFLNKGHKADRNQRERFQSGELLAEDWDVDEMI